MYEMLTLMSPPLGLGKRCPSKVAYKVDQPFLLWGLRAEQEPVGGGAGGPGVCWRLPTHAVPRRVLPMWVMLPLSLANLESSGVEDP